MTTLKHEISITAEVNTVWETLSNLLAVKLHNPQVVSVRILTDNKTGMGATRRCELKSKDWVEERVWEYNPPHILGLEVSASSWPLASMKWRTELIHRGSTTLLTQELHYALKFGVLGLLLDKLIMRRKLNDSIQAVFENLKSQIESTEKL